MVKILRKTDIVLIAFFVVLAVSLIFIFAAWGSSDVGYVVILVDRQEAYVLNLGEFDGQIFVIESERGVNEIFIKDGMVRMLNADCPDHICVHDGAISNTLHRITCLPNRVSISLRGVAPPDSGNLPNIDIVPIR